MKRMEKGLPTIKCSLCLEQWMESSFKHLAASTFLTAHPLLAWVQVMCLVCLRLHFPTIYFSKPSNHDNHLVPGSIQGSVSTLMSYC